MRFFTIARKDLNIRFTDRKGFVSMLLMPVILTAILGSALSGVFGEDESIPQTMVGVVSHAKDELTTQFIDDVLQGKELKESISLKEFASDNHLKEAVEKQQVDVGLILPAEWGAGLLKGDGKKVTILSDPEKEIQSTIIYTVTSSFVDRITSISMVTEVVTADLMASAPVSNQELNIEGFSKKLVDELSAISALDLDVVTSETDGKEPISGMQYYAAAMGVMFLLFNITIGAKSIIQERKTDTLARLMSSPIRHSSIIVGKFLGTFSFSILQFLVFVLATHFLFGVDWGSNLLQLVMMGIAYSISVAGFSMVIAGLLTEEKTADTFGGIGVQILALLGGSMIPLATFPDGLQSLSNIAPNKWALDSFINIMNGTSWNSLLLPILVLTISGFITLCLGSLKLKVR